MVSKFSSLFILKKKVTQLDICTYCLKKARRLGCVYIYGGRTPVFPLIKIKAYYK